MIITRKKKIPLHWAFYAQLPLLLSIYGNFVINAPFLLLIKKFIDNPAAIMGLISIEVYLTILGSPFIAWLSDRIWTRWGRRKFFFVIADVGRGLCLIAMPFAPNIIWLIALRWIYGAVSDFGGMTQALIYEVVPPPQRGRLSGFFQASVQFGNIVFYFLLLGRFDDYYFMGPFAQVTEMNGGAIMFWLAAMLCLGIAAYEGLGFKEIKPPDAKSINTGRKPGQSLFVHFLRSFYRDVLAKDFLPLYLLVFINIMFGVGLGIFQPLLYTEQWGYSLQDMGNTLAVGAIFSVTFALISGWFADRFGKMITFVLATAGSLAMNVFYTVYVYFQPDNRPSLLEIIVIGNISQAFAMVKGVVSFPLMMEYIKRSRMGAANAGIQLFNGIVRNGVLLFVGIWLAWWSIWLLPQAGYHVAATFPDELSEEQVRDKIEEEGVPTENLILRPLHQFGIDGETSMRWWIHRDDKRTHELLSDRKDLRNKLATLENEVDSPFLADDERQEIQDQIDELSSQLEAIGEELNQGVQDLRSRILPALEGDLFEAGEQIRQVNFNEDGTLQLTVETIERLETELIDDLVRNLSGPQYRVVPNEDPEATSRWRSDIEVTIPEGPSPALQLNIAFNPSFLELYNSIYLATSDSDAAFELSNTISSIFQGEMGRGKQQFSISQAEFQSQGEDMSLAFTLRIAKNALQSDPQILADALAQESAIAAAHVTNLDEDLHRFSLEIRNHGALRQERDPLAQARVDEVYQRMDTLLPQKPQAHGLVSETYLRLADALASNPFYVTIPEHTPRSDYQEREYEYFFSSKLLEIFTDFFGFGIIALLVYLEKRGVIHRSGAEEDLNR